MKLVKQINNLIQLPYLTFFLYTRIRRQKSFVKNTIQADLNKFMTAENQGITESDVYKIKYYYGVAVPVIAEIYKQILNKKFSQKERKTLTYLGATTGLFDDLLDEAFAEQSHLKSLLENPNPTAAKTAKEALLIMFYLKALEQNDAALIQEYALKVFEAQVESKKQLDPNLSLEEITEITRQKGGASLLFYRSVLEDEISEKERNLIFQIGFMGQLENDIFDIYKDYQAGIRTLATEAKDMTYLRQIFIKHLNEILSTVANLHQTNRSKLRFSRLLVLVASRALVALDQLENLQKERFEISQYERKQLICDMGKTRNILLWLRYYLKWNNALK